MRQSTLVLLTVPNSSTEREGSEMSTEERLLLYSEVRLGVCLCVCIHVCMGGWERVRVCGVCVCDDV